MSGWTDFVHNLGFGTSNATNDAKQNLDEAKKAYQDLETPDLVREIPQIAETSDQGPSAYNGIAVNPAYKEAQMEQLAALRNLAANGGRNAASEANLARIQQNEDANARGQRDAILANANARGMGGSGASLLAQLSASQNATNNQSARDMDVLGQEANTAINAGNTAANIGSNLNSSDYAQQASKAQAADAINRFNASQRTGMNQYNVGQNNAAQQFNSGLGQTEYQNKVQKQAGIAGSNMGGVNFNQNQANMGAQQAGNILGAVIKGGAAAAAAATGGKVPGMALVDGDSRLNDSVPINTSPGEVVVPRTLAKSGSPSEISRFVKHPPQIKASQDKEAMLSALANLKRRRG